MQLPTVFINEVTPPNPNLHIVIRDELDQTRLSILIETVHYKFNGKSSSRP